MSARADVQARDKCATTMAAAHDIWSAPPVRPDPGQEEGRQPRVGDQMSSSTKGRVLSAANRAHAVYPGPVGELLAQELRSWLIFGRFLGSDLIMRIVDGILDEQPREPSVATEVATLHPARPGTPVDWSRTC